MSESNRLSWSKILIFLLTSL